MNPLFNYISRIFSFRKEENRQGFTVGAMHWVNRISILMFLVAMVILILKLRK